MKNNNKHYELNIFKDNKCICYVDSDEKEYVINRLKREIEKYTDLSNIKYEIMEVETIKESNKIECKEIDEIINKRKDYLNSTEYLKDQIKALQDKLDMYDLFGIRL